MSLEPIATVDCTVVPLLPWPLPRHLPQSSRIRLSASEILKLSRGCHPGWRRPISIPGQVVPIPGARCHQTMAGKEAHGVRRAPCASCRPSSLPDGCKPRPFLLHPRSDFVSCPAIWVSPWTLRFSLPYPTLRTLFCTEIEGVLQDRKMSTRGTGRWECHLTLGQHWHPLLFPGCCHYIWDILYVFSMTFWCSDFMSLTCTSMNAKLIWKTVDHTKLGGYRFPFQICLLVVWPLGLPVLASTMTSEENSPLLSLFFLRLEGILCPTLPTGVPLILIHM